jgi:anti-anti-sigma factor
VRTTLGHAAPSLLHCRIVETETAVHLVVAGEVDLSNAGDLDAALADGVRRAGGRPVLVDLIGLGFCAAVGVRVLVAAARRARSGGADLRFHPRSCAVDLALDICGQLAEIAGAPGGAARPVARIGRRSSG